MTKDNKDKSISKKDLITAVAKETGLKNTEATKAVEALLDSVTQALAKGNEVRLVGFGTFSVVSREARIGRNPRTGDSLKIAAKKAPRFRPGKEFREAIA